MACTWLRRLYEHYPDLALRARELNRRDGFVMWEDDPVAQKKWARKKAEKERKKREKMLKKQARGKKDDDSSSDSDKSEMDMDNSESKRLAKKEKWGEHRTTERRKDDMQIDSDCATRVVSPC